jgi:aminoglycoside phosphotransferase (APT) family kinase protein
MAHQWQPEREVDVPLARVLVRAQFPDVAADIVELVAAGWDYTVFRVDGEWGFRFPRRAIVLGPLARELRVMPCLAPLVPLPLPVPVHVGRPSGRYPWPFYGARWLPGDEASIAVDRRALARPLAGFLRRLHAPEVLGELAWLPVDVVGRADMSVRVPRTRDELAAVAAEGLWRAPQAVHELLRRAEQLAPAEPTAVCHGDLHFRQVLVDRGRLAGIVDWVDVCRSDPGIDLQLAFSFLAPPARDEFLEAYGPVAEDSLVRARVLALFLSAVLARYGRERGLRAVEREAVASLDRAVTGLVD